jgi:hypothetical protein
LQISVLKLSSRNVKMIEATNSIDELNQLKWSCCGVCGYKYSQKICYIE